MSIVQLLVIVMVVTVLATMTLAVVSYSIFRMRESNAPDRVPGDPASPLFFERVRFVSAKRAEGG